jgi:uncharacterized protein
MRLDVTQLLREPIGTHTTVEFSLGFQRLSDELSVQAVRGRLILLHENKGILVQGLLLVDIELECSRCLSPVANTIEVELDDLFRLANSPGDDQNLIIGSDHNLDLRPVLRDLVIVSTPMHVLCKPDCAGLCPNCGQNLNEGSCDCQVEDIDPRLAALKALIE